MKAMCRCGHDKQNHVDILIGCIAESLKCPCSKYRPITTKNRKRGKSV